MILNSIAYLKSLGFTKISEFRSDEQLPLSSVFLKDQTLVIIDHLAIFTTPFTYGRYCQSQNEWMNQYVQVYRWIEDDINQMKLFLEDSDSSDKIIKSSEQTIQSLPTFNRENLAESSVLEEFFERQFQEVYGLEAFKYLKKEYPILMKNGEVGYLDFVLFHQDQSMLVIEENGVSYHHPLIIQKERYQKVLMKQNSIVAQNGKVFRWDSSSMSNSAKVCDEIREFIGEISLYKIQTSLRTNRSFQLYEHQENTLNHLKSQRANGLEASLVVLPTGTGKSRIAIEDIVQFCNEQSHQDQRFLILVPSVDLRNQWEESITQAFQSSASTQSIPSIEIRTFSYLCRHYQNLSKTEYDYILIDEAHHAMADILQKAIHYFNPKFLLGLTATDQRLDQKKLNDLFGSYEHTLDLKDAIEQNLLSPIRIYRLKTNVDLSKVKFNGKDYVNADLERTLVVDSRNQIIANLIDQYFNPRIKNQDQSFFSGLVFCVSVKHAEKMARMLKEKGISAESVAGHDPRRFEKINAYQNREIQFLCTCSLLTEGWDAPFTSVIVMARPTFSRTLYTQQIGRGTRKYPNKEALYVIDVVDQYGVFQSHSIAPWSAHALLKIAQYRPPFHEPFTQSTQFDPQVSSIHIVETEIALEPIDLFTFDKLYDQTLSTEQLARELFISTSTLMNWIKKNEVIPDYELPLGRKSIYLFKKEQIEDIRLKKNLSIHNEHTIVTDFWDFIGERDYTFSYKIYFLLSFLEMADSEGNLSIEKLYECYTNYYLARHKQGLKIEKKTSPYHQIEFLKNKDAIITSILNNPYEKFERKRFMSYAKDLSLICMHHKIWADLNQSGQTQKLKNQLLEDLNHYEKRLEMED